MSDQRPDWRSALGAVVDDQRRDLGPHPQLGEITAYHRGALAPEGLRRIEDHLVLCPECARLLLDLEAFREDAARPEREPGDVLPMAPPRPPARRSGAAVRERSSRRRRLRVAAAAAVAAAALLTLWPWARGAPLPDYVLHSTGHVDDLRSADPAAGEVLVAITGHPLAWVLQPQTAVAPPVVARAYLNQDGELQTLSASTLEVDDQGVVTLAGVIGATLHLPIGESELVLVVARPAALPSRARLEDELAAGSEARGKRWLAVRRTVRVEEAGDDPPPSAFLTGDGNDPWIEFAGCAAILVAPRRPGPLCVLPEERRLTLWMRRSPGAEVRFESGGWRQPSAPVPAAGGARYTIEVSGDELVAEVRRETGLSIWSLALAEPLAEPAWLAEARAVYARGELAGARHLLEPRTSEPDPRWRARVLGLLARIAGREGRAAEAEGYYRRAARLHRRAGNLFAEVDERTALLWELSQQKRFPEAAELLDALPVDALGGSSLARYWAAYWRGLIAGETGDLRAALRAMDGAAREAQRAGLLRERIYGEDMLAQQLHAAGLEDAAADLRARVWKQASPFCTGDEARSSRAPLNVCDCVHLRNNQAWARLLDLEAGRAASDPTGLLQDSEQILVEDPGSCAQPEDLPNVRLNLALAALHAGDLERARNALARADTRGFPRLELWRLDVEARIARAASGPGQALDLYRELGRRAAQADSPEAAWRAAYGEATALDGLGRTGDALAACARAEDLLDRESLLVPMHAGRELFLAQRQRAARFCLDLSLREGRVAEALALARRSAGRALRHLRLQAALAGLDGEDRRLFKRQIAAYRAVRAEIDGLTERIARGLPRDQQDALEREVRRRRDAGRRQLDELFTVFGGSAALTERGGAETAPATVLLAYHPLPEGWAAFAAGDQGVAAHRIDPEPELARPRPDPGALSRLLLEPFREAIVRAERIEVMTYGALRDVDFHALPFGEDILLRQAPVVYRLDLPALAPAALPPSPEALVVAGPGLRAPPEEAAGVADALAYLRPSWRVEVLAGDDASAARVWRHLGDASLFHYAGHAAFDAESRGWNSRLALARGGALTVDDVLAVPQVPTWAVLSGCETGLDSRSAPLPAIGLAQAFLVAGAETVVAATAEIADRDAARLAEVLYRHWHPSRTLAAALRAAQLEVRERFPGSGWQRFRVLSR